MGLSDTVITLLVALTLLSLSTADDHQCVDDISLSVHDKIWNDNLDVVDIVWTYGTVTCSTEESCYGVNYTTSGDRHVDAQIKAVTVQENTQVRFVPGVINGLQLSIQPWSVNESGFRDCDTELGERIINNPTNESFTVDSKYLTVGYNYFIVSAEMSVWRCDLGLKANVTVKPNVCTPSEEGSSSCSGYGICHSNPWQSEYECVCCDGYTGSTCEEYDACLSNPCLNDATCVDVDEGLLMANYTCQCAEGYEGDDCESNIDDCSSNPCSNGICVDGVDSYNCYCIPGYGGSNCEREYDECQSTPCQNGGTCTDQLNSYECSCSHGYEGSQCESKIDLCSPDPCYNGANCTDDGDDIVCTCKSGYSGDYCDVNINECEPNPCHNGAYCQDLVSSYHCYCTAGWAGLHCEYHDNSYPLFGLNDFSDYINNYDEDLDSGHKNRLETIYIVTATVATLFTILVLLLLTFMCRIQRSARIVRSKNRAHPSTSQAPQASRDITMCVNSMNAIPPLSKDAIFDASGSGEFVTSMDRPLITSLKSDRI